MTSRTKMDISNLFSNWFNLRRKRCWALIALLFYGVLGFFVVSATIKTKLVDLIEEDFGRQAHIQAVLFNPFELSLRIRQFEMRDTDGVTLASFDDFFVNFQLSSLFRWAWTFREIRLDDSYVFYERFDNAESRISRLLADIAGDNTSAEPVANKGSGGLPRLLIHELALNNGAVEIRDNVPDTPVIMPLGPININIKKLNTLPDRYGKQVVAIDLPDNARLEWYGELSLTPLDSQGELTLSRANLDVATAYLKSLSPIESVQARLSSRLNYRIKLNDNGQLDVDIDDLAVELNDVTVTGLSPSREFFALQQLALEGGSLRYPEQTVEFSRLSILNPKAIVWRKKDGTLSVSDLIPVADNQLNDQAGAVTEPVKPNDDSPQQSWQVLLQALRLNGGQVDFSDFSVAPAAELGLRELTVNADDISSQPGANIPLNASADLLQGGALALEGGLTVLPNFLFSATAKIRDIPLAIAQPYIQQFSRIRLNQGRLNTDLALKLGAETPLTIAGALQVPGLEIKDAIESKRLLAWKNLSIEQLNLDLGTNKLKLSPLQLDQLFGRIVIYEDKSTNLSGLVVEQKQTVQNQANKPQATDSESPFDVVIGGVSVNQSGLDFSDLSLPLPFATRIERLNGSISTIAINSSQPANIKLEGQVDDYGLARINGAINLLDPLFRTDIAVEFRNLLMSSLTPYTIEFAGREIAEGKLNLDLNYEITKSQLQASNKVVISDLALGAKVDHPGAADLPLGLAVALLKDVNGKIDIDLPIAGNVDDPEFKIGGIIWKAFSDLIVKAVTAPFRLLAGLIGVESDELGKFQFLAGRADLTPPELEKVAQIKEALLKRPNLSVEVKGAVSKGLDRPALKYSLLHGLLTANMNEKDVTELREVDVLDERFFKPLKALFEERFPDVPLKTVREQHKKPPLDNPEGKAELDSLAYAADLRDRLLSSIDVSDEQLLELAQARAASIKAAFLADEFDASRIVMAEPEWVEVDDGQWVQFELGVVAN